MDSGDKNGNNVGAEMDIQGMISKFAGNISPEQLSMVKDMLGDNVNLDQLLGFFNSNKNK